MDMPEVKSFNAELSGLYDNKPPISKAKMSAITRGAIKAIKFYKHVVHSVEKFIQKCKPEYKVPGLYVIDSIVRQSRHQFGQEKDVFAPRFAKNMQQTFANLFRCPPEDKRNIIRVLNLWQKNNVFSSQVIQPLLDMADPNHPLHKEIQEQQNNAANGSSLNATHNTTDNKMSPGPAQHSPHASTPMGNELLNDFEYDSDDDAPEPAPAPPSHHHHQHQHQHQQNQHQHQQNQHQHQHQQSQQAQQSQQHQTQNPADALGSILTNPEIMRQLQSLQAQMQLMTGMQIPNLMPMMGGDAHMQQNQNQNLFMNSQQEQQKQSDSKDDMANESDIEFVETGPQVIEIPDANDSRSPSPRSRRHRSRSKSPKRRRRSRSRSRSRSPRRRRDRDRDRDREREREKEKDSKGYKEREAEKEKQREREKKGYPPIKKENLSVCSTTLWVGHLSKLATPEELSDLFGGCGGVTSIDVVAPRGCAFVVMERRRDAVKALHKLNKHKLHSKEIMVEWAPGRGVKGREWRDHWEGELGVSYLPWTALQQRWALSALSLDALEDGGVVDEDTLPAWIPPRILPKAMMDNMSMLGGVPPGPGLLPPGLPPGLPPHLPAMPAMPPPMAMQVTRLPPPGMPTGLPPGMAPGLPAGIRPPSLPTGVPGLGGDGSGLLRFPGVGGGGVMGGFLGGLLGVGALPSMPAMPSLVLPVPMHHQQQQSQPALSEARADDAMELDPEDASETDAPPLLSDQLQALLSKPPPTFNASEPPPGFNLSEPPPFNASQPPPTDEKQEEDRKNDRDRDRRDRDRDRGERRDRDNRSDNNRGENNRGDNNRDRRDRDSRDRRDRDRGGRDRDRERERDDRRGGERGGRDRRDRDRDRDRPPRDGNNREERSREKSPRNANAEQNSEKSLQERLWEMANGKPSVRSEDKPREEFPEREREDVLNRSEERSDRPPLLERPSAAHDRPPPNMDNDADDVGAGGPGGPGGPMGLGGPGGPGGPGGWTQLPPRMPPPHMAAPPFRAELRMRGPPRPGIPGPWMDGPGPGPGGPPGGPGGPNFGPRFNGMGPPPFNRPPFDMPPFEGPPRFERPPFNRMPFDGMNRPPFDGPRPPFDGPRPPFDGPRPPFDGPRPPFDGPRQFDGDRPPFDGPPMFDGPPEFFDRNNRRFDDREQFNNERGWNGDRDRDREWDANRRNNEWDERRRGGDRRNRDNNEDRFRDRNDRRRNFDERPRPQWDSRDAPKDNAQDAPKDATEEAPKEAPKEASKGPSRDERKRDKDRKSRWGAAEEPALPSEDQIQDVIEKIHSIRNENLERLENSSKENVDKVDPVQEQPETISEAPAPNEPAPSAEPQNDANDNCDAKEDAEEHFAESNESEAYPSQKVSEQIDAGPIESHADEVTNNDNSAGDLYDTNETVDTSFSMPAPEEKEALPVVHNMASPEPAGGSEAMDIFDETKEAPETETVASQPKEAA